MDYYFPALNLIPSEIIVIFLKFNFSKEIETQFLKIHFTPIAVRYFIIRIIRLKSLQFLIPVQKGITCTDFIERFAWKIF